MTISSAAETFRSVIPADGLEVRVFPFSFGRRPRDGERTPALPVDLTVDDDAPFRISRLQFTLVRSEVGLSLVDASSARGTIVNGQIVGQGASTEHAPLHVGSNDIIAGGIDSPYRLSLELAFEAAGREAMPVDRVDH